jgi:hypothetical protein
MGFFFFDLYGILTQNQPKNPLHPETYEDQNKTYYEKNPKFKYSHLFVRT